MDRPARQRSVFALAARLGVVLLGTACGAEAPVDPVVACQHVRAAVCERARSCRSHASAWVAACLASAESLYGTCAEEVKGQSCAQVDGFELESCAGPAATTACTFFTAKAAYSFAYPMCAVHCVGGP